MATHSSTLAWKIPWAEEPGRLQSMGSLRIGHDWATSLSLFTFMHWRRKWQPTPVFLLGESQGQGAWWAAVYGVAQSQTWLKWLSSSSSQTFQWIFLKGWFLLALTGLISLLFKGVSRVFPAPQFKSIDSLAVSLLYGSTLTFVHDYWKNHSFDYTDLCWQLSE